MSGWWYIVVGFSAWLILVAAVLAVMNRGHAMSAEDQQRFDAWTKTGRWS